MTDEINKILSSDSFSSQTFSDMKNLCATSLRKLGLSAFEYARVYDDHTALVLYSDPDIARYVINQELHITAHMPKEIIASEFWFMPDANGPYSRHVKEIKDITSSTALVNYVVRHVGFYEMFCFWSAGEHSVASNKLINMKESLEAYSMQFLEQAKNLISLVDQHRFQLTANMRPNFNSLSSTSHNVNINTNLGFYILKLQQQLIKIGTLISPRLTAQELKCIPYLLEGKTAVDMASLLNLSPRTVEMHINAIKNKLGCDRKSEIISKLINIANEHLNKV